MRAAFTLFFVLLSTPALAADSPYLWVKPAAALAYGPLGLIGDVKIQARTPLHRSDSIVFQNTYAGIGGRAAITPAFVDVGPRFSLAPIDVFDVDVQLGVRGVWPSSSGLIPFTQLSGTLDSQRDARKKDARAGQLLYASVNPTFKIKVGPLVAFTSADFAFIHNIDELATPYVYEAYSDMLIARDDVVLTSYTGILGEILDGKKTAVLLRAGALLRHRQAFVSKDISTAVGGAVTVKPGRKPGWPTVLLGVLGYVRDVDRALKAPNIQLQVSWEMQKPFAPKGAPDAEAGGDS
jgi:hypothetical protein